MQHQRAVVMTDESIIDQGEREQREVNSARAGKSRLLPAEPSAAVTKKIASSGIRSHNRDNPALWRQSCCPPCLYLEPYLEQGRAPLRAAPAPRARSRPAARAAPEHRSVGSQDWLGTAAVGTQPWVVQPRCPPDAVGMRRDVRVNWQR